MRRGYAGAGGNRGYGNVSGSGRNVGTETAPSLPTLPSTDPDSSDDEEDVTAAAAVELELEMDLLDSWVGEGEGQPELEEMERPFSAVITDQLRSATLGHLLAHQRTFEELFPPNFFLSELSNIRLSSFSDTESADSLFDPAGPNHAVLQPLQAKLRQALGVEQARKGTSSREVFERSQEYLASLLVCIYTMTAVPPRTFQAVDFRYASDAQALVRNFRLVEGSQGVFVNPKQFRHSGKRAGTGCRDNRLWLLPPQVTLSLILYLGLIRPVELALAERDSRFHANHPSLQAMKTHVFCNPERRATSKVWSADDAEALLKLRSPLAMEGQAHRLVYAEMIDRYFPHILDRMEGTRVLDNQSQHSSRTAAHHYAVERLQSASGLHFTAREKHMVICQAMHAFMYLVKPIHGLEPTKRLEPGGPQQLGQACFSSDIREGYTLDLARDLILQQYASGGLTADCISVDSQKRYTRRSFLYCHQEDVPQDATTTTSRLGDGTLIQVVRTMYGGPLTGAEELDEVLSLLSSGSVLNSFEGLIGFPPPPPAFPPSLQIMAALSEWFTGHLTPCDGRILLCDPSWQKLVQSVRDELAEHVGKHAAQLDGLLNCLSRF
ncbi:hypothetical protein M378DRAFT_18075 [Amanita muscaria Koide BX008]|uniref:Uncharacterized protein n=1 Tax=Amanita muscaria (strain Koide BX008) TaxID=946122 RepID=A0A0C2W2F5_AMAMK|nr:hypothetical protein M378DRAFT_18075 [Amanita muscaria Koide BX008]